MPGADVSEPREVRTRDAERTQKDILREATAEFAERGFAGGRVDEIAARTATTKRMIYYYFGSKRSLYLAVLEAAYTEARAAEQAVDVKGLTPVDALRALAEAGYEHATQHQDFIRLVAIENMHHAEFLRESTAIKDMNDTTVSTLQSVLDRGAAEGTFRSDIDALDAHMMISAYAVFSVANRSTFGALFDRDLLEPGRQDHYRRLAGDMVVAALSA